MNPSMAKKIYIVNFDNNQPLDSAVIKNGKFAFSTKTTGTALPAALAIEGRKVASFIFEPGNLSINEKRPSARIAAQR